jgi:hypothetical protein
MNEAIDKIPTVVPQEPVVQHTNSLHARVRRKEFNLTARQYKKRLKDMRRGAANKIYSVITKEPA